ncbi:Charged multivesicular body protein [Cyanidiococcus yangmingshanensis]|uniref:Charged multivesicular body protein n=1 Tax=Cyanidiococcus yangmingshanensis TaxID=2690220 RepID=A0A7J7IBL5_9RHOD|nr:Charged multivesicular body protein [Cyanidiococcus yangmingshanensis]
MEALKNIFGYGETPAQKLRRYKRTIDRAVREVDRERMKMQRLEQQRKNEIRRLARESQMKSVRIAARDLVRVRNCIAKMYELRSQMQSVQMQLSTMRSSEAMTNAMRGIVKSMHLMNRQVNLPRIGHILHEFERESEILSLKQEVIDDAMDNAIADEDENEETEQVVNQVLDELGLEHASRLEEAPQSPAARAVRAPAARDLSAGVASLPDAEELAIGGGGGAATPGKNTRRPHDPGNGWGPTGHRSNDDHDDPPGHDHSNDRYGNGFGSGGGGGGSILRPRASGSMGVEPDELEQRLENLKK